MEVVDLVACYMYNDCNFLFKRFTREFLFNCAFVQVANTLAATHVHSLHVFRVLEYANYIKYLGQKDALRIKNKCKIISFT